MDKTVQLALNGANFTFPDWESHQYGTGVYEKSASRVMLAAIEPGMTVVDIGAAFGFYTSVFASEVGKYGQVVAFEPSLMRFEYLFNNCTGSNVMLHRAAVSDERGHLAFCGALAEIGQTKSGGTIAYSRNWNYEADYDIPTVFIRDFVSGPVGFIKSDCDGWEPKVVPEIASILKDNPLSAGMVEFSRDRLRRHEFEPKDYLEQLLDSFNYVYAIIPSLYSIDKPNILHWLLNYPRYCKNFLVANDMETIKRVKAKLKLMRRAERECTRS